MIELVYCILFNDVFLFLYSINGQQYYYTGMINKKIDQGPVLLVCVYNRFGNIITHDYLYQLFAPYGQIVKILIFEKAKVWKTFIEFKQSESAAEALINLNNKIIFQDGSKMNIFHSKLKHVQFQNDNLGGVNYENLKSIQELTENNFAQTTGIRKRNSTFQDHFSQVHQSNMNEFIHFEYFDQNKINEKMNHYRMPQQSNYFDLNHSDSTFQKQQSLNNYSNRHNNNLCMQNSDSTLHKSKTVNSKRSFTSSFNNLGDIDDLFRQIALQSNQYREWQQIQLKNRKKAKTIVNPNSQQFMIQNCPSRVIFIRSIPQNFNHQCIYNIFINFGSIVRMIFMKEKLSALIQYQQVFQAIRAKDQINYVKSDFKIFYSHYQSLVLRKDCEDELSLDYTNKSIKNNSISNVSISSNSNKKKPFNPPSQILFITMINPSQQSQLKKKCLEIGCKIFNLEWKQNGKDKWMCLVKFHNINDSLQALGMLQNEPMSNGKKLKLAFTRSKINGSGFRSVEESSSQMSSPMKIYDIQEEKEEKIAYYEKKYDSNDKRSNYN